MSASSSSSLRIQKKIGVTVRVLGNGCRHRRRIPLPRNSTESVDPLDSRQLKIPLDGRGLGAKNSTVKRVAEMDVQEYVTRFAVQAAEATNTLAIFSRLHDKSKSIERH